MTDRAFHHSGGSGSAQDVDLYRLAGLSVRPFAALASHFRRRAALADLSALDDRMLSDIGLQRFDIEDAARLPLSQDVTRFLRERAIERKRSATRGVHRRHLPGDGDA